MNKYTVTLLRDQLSTVITNNSIGTDAFNAVSTIPFCADVTVLNEADDSARIEFKYPSGAPQFLDTGTHLAKFALKKL